MTGNRRAVALVGFGSMSRLGPLPAITDDPTLKLMSIVDPSPEARAQAAELAPAAAVYASLSELRDGESPDLVVLASPTQLHAGGLEELAGWDCSVLCEKPLVTSRLQLERVAQRWRGREDSLKVVHNYAYSASRIQARCELLAGRIGAWRGTTVDVALSPGSFIARSSWRSLPESGGPLLDVGYHYVYLAEFFSGRPVIHASLVANTAERQELVLTHAYGGETKIHLTLRAERSSSVVRLAGGEGELELVGARQLSVRDRSGLASHALEAGFSDGYREMLHDALDRRPRDDSFRGHFHEAARLLTLMFDALEASTPPRNHAARTTLEVS